MRTIDLGGKTVGQIGFGAMQLAGPGVMGPPRDPAAARAVLRRAVELGIDLIDTSQYYGPDVVNDLIRETLHPYPEGLKLMTKVGARRDDQGAWLPAHSPAELRQGVEDNLRSLRVERLDLVNLRVAGPGGAPGEALPEQLETLTDLQREGKLDLIGLSNVTRASAEQALDQTDQAGQGQIVEIQNNYSLLDRTEEDVLDLCAERGLVFVPFFPLGSAFRGGPKLLAADPAIAQVAAAHEATPAQIALAWLATRYPGNLLIPGTSSVAHLEENLAAADIELSDNELARLDEVQQAPMRR